MARYVGAIDQGTTSSRFIVFDEAGGIAGQHQLEHRQILPRPGWVEHDPIEILKRTEEVIAGGMRNARVLAADLAAIGVTNQRETTVVWNPKTGEPWTNAIVWQDTRTDRIVAGLERDGHGAAIRRKTGLPPATYFSAPKLQWILENVDGVRRAADRGEALVGTIDTWIIWNLTGGPDGGVHVTDVTNASRTMLANLETLTWDDELLALFGVSRSMLPEIRPSSDRRSVRYDSSRRPDRRRGAHLGGPRRSAGGDGRSGLLRARHGQEHVRHRQFYAPQHRDPPSPVDVGTADDGVLSIRRPANRVRARGICRGDGLRRAMVAGSAGHHSVPPPTSSRSPIR